MFCPKCGTDVSDGKFCPSCGELVQRGLCVYCKSCGNEMNENQAICLKCGCSKGTGTKYCANCGSELTPNAAACLKCGAAADFGVPVKSEELKDPKVSNSDWFTTLMLCLFLGGLGVHRFYVGKTGTGFLWLISLGLLGIGSLFDLIQLLCGEFTDADGKLVMRKK